MSGEGQFVVSRDGTKIWAQASGDHSKPAIVFIHGFSCTALHFEKQFSDPEMSANLYLVRYETRGHGRSDQPLDAEAYESVHHADDFKVVCDAFDIVKPFLAGWSIGGTIAADVATYYGVETMSGCILLGGIPYRSMHHEVAHPVIMNLIPGLLSSSVEEFSKACIEFPISCVADEFKIPDQTRMFWSGALAIQHPLVRVHSLHRTQDETALVNARKTFPFLVIHGDKDKHMYIDNMERFMKSNFENVEFHRLEGVGHAAFYERPAVVNSAIMAFVERILD